MWRSSGTGRVHFGRREHRTCRQEGQGEGSREGSWRCCDPGLGQELWTEWMGQDQEFRLRLCTGSSSSHLFVNSHSPPLSLPCSGNPPVHFLSDRHFMSRGLRVASSTLHLSQLGRVARAVLNNVRLWAGPHFVHPAGSRWALGCSPSGIVSNAAVSICVPVSCVALYFCGLARSPGGGNAVHTQPHAHTLEMHGQEFTVETVPWSAVQGFLITDPVKVHPNTRACHK